MDDRPPLLIRLPNLVDAHLLLRQIRLDGWERTVAHSLLWLLFWRCCPVVLEEAEGLSGGGFSLRWWLRAQGRSRAGRKGMRFGLRTNAASMRSMTTNQKRAEQAKPLQTLALFEMRHFALLRPRIVGVVWSSARARGREPDDRDCRHASFPPTRLSRQGKDEVRL